MNASPFNFLRRKFFVMLCCAFCSAHIAYAVNHNPETQPQPGARTTDVTLNNPRFIASGESYTASVEVDGGVYPDLLELGGPIFVSVFNAETSEPLDAQEIVSEGPVTFSLTAESNPGCSIYFEINGLTGGTAESDTVALQAGSGYSTSSVNAYYDLGNTLNGGSAGQLLLYANRPSANIYTPAGIKLVVSSPSVEVIRVGANETVRQVLSATQLTDVVTLSSDSYEIRFYRASQKGAKTGGLYQPTGLPFRVAKIENPGITPIAATEDDTLYVSARWERSFAYKLPLADGPYRVELHFAELYHDTVGDALFGVKAEGTAVLSNYDVLAAAGSKNTARMEEIQTTVVDGELNLDFSSTFYGAQLAALKVVRDGEVTIAGTSDETLYQSERTGNFAYALPLLNGNYDVVLHFSESTYAQAGKRVFDVTVEGTAVLENYDIYVEAGAPSTARTATIPVTLTDGVLDLAFLGVTGEASLAAITVIDTASSNVVAAVNAGGPAYTAADSTEFIADAHFTGGQVRFPGQVAYAINAGGGAYVADDGTQFAADNGFVGGFAYLGAINRVQITDTEGGSSQLYEYTWVTEPRTGAFEETILTHAGGLKKEGISVIYSQDEQTYVETRTLRDSLDNLVSKVARHYEKFPFGYRKVSEVIDPDGLALTTTWTYIEGTGNPADPKPDGYGKEKNMNRYDGYWEIYAYDAEGRLRKTTSRYLSSTTREDADNKVDTIDYANINPIRTRVTAIQGQETTRTYEAEFDDVSNSEFERWTITAVTPGAVWDAADNLISKNRIYKSAHPTNHLRGQTKWTRSPNGTMTIYTYAMSGDDRIVTRDNGEPNGTGTAIVAGTRTTTTTNLHRQQIAEGVIDIASGLTLSDWEALTVDSLGRPTVIGYGDGTIREIAYVGSAASCGSCSGSGKFLIASETDRDGVTTTYAYDALNRRTETTRLGVTDKVVYDAADRIVERLRIGTSGPAILLQKTNYDLAGRVTSTEDALGYVTDYNYAYLTGGGFGNGRVTTITLPAATSGAERGTRIQTTYADGRLKEISGTAVSPVRYTYGSWSSTGLAGQWTRVIKVGEADAETEWTQTYTDFAGRTVKQEYPAATGTVSATMAYNAKGQLIRQTDPDGVQTLFAYNAEGEREYTVLDWDRDGVIDYAGLDRITRTTTEVVSKSDAIVRRATTRVWHADNTDAATVVSISEREGYGNHRWQTDSAGAVTAAAVDRTAAGAWTVTRTAPDGSQQVQTYTSGRLASTTLKNSSGGQVAKIDYAYDAHGRVSTQTDARTGAVAYTYTDRDEVLTTTANNGTETTTYTYDALGNQLTITRPDASVTANEYHLRNRQIKKTSGSQTYPVEYTYDLHGRMKTMTTWQNATSSSGAAITTWNYDTQRGWLAQKLYADSTGPAYEYTPAGRLAKRTWARTVSSAPLTTIYAYNNAGELNSTDYSDSTPDVAITYTRFGAQKTLTDATGTRTFTYTAALRPDQEQLPAFYGDRILTRSYQGTGSGEVPGRSDGFELGITGDLDQDYSVIYGYDTAGRLGTVTDPNGTFTYGYLANSPLRSSTTSAVHTSTWTYEPYRNVIASLENKVGATAVSKFDYTVNSLGQRTQRANSGTAFATASTDVFAYNAKGEVESATNATLTARAQSFVYDDIGNRLTFTNTAGTTNYTANSLNQYAAIASVTPTHDEDGNQTATGLGQAYVWDAENRLTVVEPLIPGTGDKKVLNTYDAQSRRVRRVVLTYGGSGWNLTTDEKFIYDGWNVVAVIDSSILSALRVFTWGLDLSGSLQGAGGVGGLLAVKDGANVYHYTYDANGNVSEVLDNTGAVVAHYEYDAFGDTFVASGTYAATNEYRFSTKPLDATSGLYYYGFRYYNPSTARWPSRDPIRERGGLNLYAYVANSPLSYIDPLGLMLESRDGSYVVDTDTGSEYNLTDSNGSAWNGIYSCQWGGSYVVEGQTKTCLGYVNCTLISAILGNPPMNIIDTPNTSVGKCDDCPLTYEIDVLDEPYEGLPDGNFGGYYHGDLGER